MLTEKKFFDLITDIRKHNFPHMFIFIGEVLELKLCLINEIKESLTKRYNTSPHLVVTSLKTNAEPLDQLIYASMFNLPFIYWITDFDKLLAPQKQKEAEKPIKKDSQSSVPDLHKYLPVFKKIPQKPEEHIVVCDYEIASWLWSKESLTSEMQSLELLSLDSVYFLSFEIQERYLSHWILRYCKSYNYEIEMDAANYIAENLGADIGRAIREVQKAFVYVLPYKNITLTAIQECLSEHKALSDFQLYDYFAEKDPEATLAAILRLKEEAHDPLEICRTLRNEIEKMFYVQSHDPSTLVKYGISSKSIPYLQKRSHKYGREELLQTLSILDDADKSMKENNKLAWEIFISAILHILS